MRVDNPRNRGHGEWDVTSYHVDQKTWGPSRINDWPNMPGKLLFRLECKDYPIPAYQPEIWFDKGRVVLDGDNNSIKKWANIPLTLASNADAWLMENIRREDTRITLKDFRARMPRQVQTKNGSSKPLGGLSALGMRMSRFRLGAACPAWNEREGSDVIQAYVKGLLSAEGLAANSTEELSGLTQWQQAECQKSNKGLYPERAGDRALSQEERKRRNETEAARLATLNPQLADVKAVEYDQQQVYTDDQPPPAQILITQPKAHVKKHKRSHAVTSDEQLDLSPKRRNVQGSSSSVLPPERPNLEIFQPERKRKRSKVLSDSEAEVKDLPASKRQTRPDIYHSKDALARHSRAGSRARSVQPFEPLADIPENFETHEPLADIPENFETHENERFPSSPPSNYNDDSFLLRLAKFLENERLPARA